MADERRVPGARDVTARPTDQTVPATDHVDGKILEYIEAHDANAKLKTKGINEIVLQV